MYTQQFSRLHLHNTFSALIVLYFYIHVTGIYGEMVGCDNAEVCTLVYGHILICRLVVILTVATVA